MATNYVSNPVQLQGGYSYIYKLNPDGTTGVDYFDAQGQPVTNTQFGTATGVDTSAIEANSPTGSASSGGFLTAGGNAPVGTSNGGGTVQSNGYAQDALPINSPLDSTTTNVFGNAGLSGGGSGNSATDNGTKIFGGQLYNLNDQTQRLSYYQAVQQQLASQRDQALQGLNQAFKTNDQQSVAQYQRSLSQLDQNMADIGSSAKQFADNYFQTVNQFNQQKGTGDVNRQNYFAQISPNAFQSSQATSQQYANDQYSQGLTQLANQGQEATGLGFLNAYNPQSQVDYSQFDPNSQFGRNISSVTGQRSDLQNSFNLFNQGQAQNLQNQQSQVGQKYQDAVGSNAEQLGQIDLQQGGNPFQYGVQSITPYQAPNVDLNQYTPYTNFQALSNPSLPGSSYKAPTTPNAFTQPALDQWLGRTNTNLPATQKNAWFNQYMMGKVAS